MRPLRKKRRKGDQWRERGSVYRKKDTDRKGASEREGERERRTEQERERHGQTETWCGGVAVFVLLD